MSERKGIDPSAPLPEGFVRIHLNGATFLGADPFGHGYHDVTPDEAAAFVRDGFGVICDENGKPK